MSVSPPATSTAAYAPPAGNRPAGLDDVAAIGQTLEREGRQQDARALYERALHDRQGLSAAEAAQLVRWVARTYIQESALDAARDCAVAALAISQAAADEGGLGHAENILAIVEWKLSNLDEADRLFRRAHHSAHVAGEARLAAMTASNIGVIATVRGDDGVARLYFEAALRDARAGGLADQAVAALVNLGLLHMHLARYDDADRAFTEARELAELIGDIGMRITVELDLAKLRLRQERHDEARTLAQRASSLAEHMGATHADGESAHVDGLVACAHGELAAAEAHFLRAEEIAQRRSDMILEGETARELAALYREQGRNRQTLQRLTQAHRLFSQLRARRELADVDRRTAMLESDFLEVVRKWGESIESKDIYTQGHCVRVADLACALWARVSQGDAISAFWFRIGALLHDVGKLLVPAEVLNKPGKLSDEEWELVRRHPSAGVELLADIEFPWDVLPIVESHHERWDGTGYPHGLAGEAIPLTARVVCIADVYDALTSRRSYKERFNHDQAMIVMRRDRGRAFDPVLFDHFEEVVRDGTWSTDTGDHAAQHEPPGAA
ncbi:MAG TPA: HD domain-containing phosphohydrolase [Gemmatimonadaceae bacterium]|nr:HD domain-containing phosphohydrolase [Gemmatimonadaceae bacterium]